LVSGSEPRTIFRLRSSAFGCGFLCHGGAASCSVAKESQAQAHRQSDALPVNEMSGNWIFAAEINRFAVREHANKIFLPEPRPELRPTKPR
jgi:hypothetical protein